MAFWVYLLKCSDGTYYTGHTDDLEKRIGEHMSGQCGGYTALRRPLKLAFTEYFPTRLEAITMEKRIKGWSKAKKEALIAGDWERLSSLARRKTKRDKTSN